MRRFTHTGLFQRAKTRGFSFRDRHSRAQVYNTKNCKLRHVDPRVKHTAYKHLHPHYTRVEVRNMERGVYRIVNPRIGAYPTSTSGTHGNGPLQERGSTSRSVHPRARDAQTKRGGYRKVDPRLRAYTRVLVEHTEKSG